MKDSVDVIKNTFSISQYAGMSLPAFFLIGTLVTAVIQSSSAVGVMTLAAVSAGIISFPASIAIVMGANIGTTFTGVIASL
jgi:phosphate:Na+ symporter